MAALTKGFTIPRKIKATNQAVSVDDLSSTFSELTTSDVASTKEISKEASLSRIPKKDAARKVKAIEDGINDLNTSFSTMGVSEKNVVEEAPSEHERVARQNIPPLRDYQIDLVNAVNQRLELNRSNNSSSSDKSGRTNGKSRGVLAYLPTGGGKTRVALELTLLEVARGGTVLFVVNRDTLAYQTEAVFTKAPSLEGKVDMLCGSASRESTGSDGNDSIVIIATIQTLTQRYLATSNSNSNATVPTLKKASTDCEATSKKKHNTSGLLRKATLVIIDECHCAVATSYLALASAYPSVPLLGLTATPYRLNPTEPLAAVFNVAVAGPSVSALVERGFLVPPIVYGERCPCTQAIAESEATFRRALKLWRRHAAQNTTHPKDSSGKSNTLNGKSGTGSATMPIATSSPSSEGIEGRPRYRNRATIAFCCSVKHSLALVTYLQANGVRAAHVDGDTPRGDRDAALRHLKIGLLDVVSSVGVLSEGFDEPRVECVLLLRPTQSRGLYIQQVGRGLRTCAVIPPGNLNDEEACYDEISTWSSGCESDEESTAAENARRLASAARANAVGKTSCIVLDCVGNIGRFGPIVGPGPAYAWEDDNNSYDDAATEATAGKKQAGQRAPPLAQCACGAISHQRLARCPGCGDKLARQQMTSFKQDRKAQLKCLRAFRAQEIVPTSRSETDLSKPKHTGSEPIFHPRDNNVPLQHHGTNKGRTALSQRQTKCHHGQKCSSETKSKEIEVNAQAPKVTDRTSEGGNQCVESNRQTKSFAPLSPLPR